MSDAVIFVAFFGGLFVLRILVATVAFLFLVPRGDRCPVCDEVTLHMEARFLARLLPWFRPSWCMRCGWEGMLRRGQVSPALPAREPAGRR